MKNTKYIFDFKNNKIYYFISKIFNLFKKYKKIKNII